MKIRLDQVDEPFVWQETLEVSTDELDHPELVDLGTVECRGRVSPMDESFLLRAEMSYEQELRCMRCLKPITIPFVGDIDLILAVGGSEARGQPQDTRERELESDDLGVLPVADGVLDTRPILIEQIHLSIPMKPICQEDCAGLCSSCGADLNAGPCDCKDVADPRWQALAALKRTEEV